MNKRRKKSITESFSMFSGLKHLKSRRVNLKRSHTKNSSLSLSSGFTLCFESTDSGRSSASVISGQFGRSSASVISGQFFFPSCDLSLSVPFCV